MEHVRHQARMLASVTNSDEARLVAALGADIIDAKNPAAGALGALPAATITAIRTAVPGHLPVSATVGDPVDDPEVAARGAVAMAQAGAGIVKVGLRKDAGDERTLARLGKLDLSAARFVGVLIADDGVAFDLIEPARAAGFAGLMLDTADKRRGALPDVVDENHLRRFVTAVHAAGMFAGLAGSWRAEHVPGLLRLGPDVLGFRGGVCRLGDRTGAIDADAARAVRSVIPVCDAAQASACRTSPTDVMARRQTESAR
jgi:uncharacterized protein (UPF0264 family)